MPAIATLGILSTVGSCFLCSSHWMSLVLSAISRPFEISNTDFLLGNCLLVLAGKLLKKEQPLRPTGETTWNFRANLWNSRSPQHCGQLRHRGRVLAGRNGIQILTMGRTKDVFFSYHLKFEPFPHVFSSLEIVAQGLWRGLSEPRNLMFPMRPLLLFSDSALSKSQAKGILGTTSIMQHWEVRAQFEISSKINWWVKLPFGDPIWSNHILWNCRGGQEKIW